MGAKARGTLINPKDYPGVSFGTGVVIYGKVKIGKGTQIGDYTILGIPTIDHVRDSEPLSETIIGKKVIIGPYCVINNGARIGSKVEIEEYCKIGWKSKIGPETMIMYRAQIHWNVQIGTRCVIGGFCGDCSVIEDRVAMFGSLIHKYQDPLTRRYKAPTILWKEEGGTQPAPIIRELSVVGFDAIIIGDIEVCSKSFICAKAIVTKNVKYPQIVVAGNNHHLTKIEWKNRKKNARHKK